MLSVYAIVAGSVVSTVSYLSTLVGKVFQIQMQRAEISVQSANIGLHLHLDYLAELPERSIVFHVDRGDIFEAHKKLGDKFCISGGVPNDLLAYGTPDEVRDRCKKVIDGVAGNGGYIMDAAAIMQDDTKAENLKAMTDFTREYGVY